MTILVASITKHDGDYVRLKDWFSYLPMKYPEHRIGNVKEGQYVLYTKARGLEILD